MDHAPMYIDSVGGASNSSATNGVMTIHGTSRNSQTMNRYFPCVSVSSPRVPISLSNLLSERFQDERLVCLYADLVVFG